MWTSNVNLLTDNQPPYDPAMGTYQLRALLCRVEPADPPQSTAKKWACKKAPGTEERPMRIDAYTHFFPKKFFDTMNEVAGQYKDMGKRVRGIPPLYDLDARKKIIDNHKDYAQIIAYPQPIDRKAGEEPAADRRVLPHSSTTASPNCARRNCNISPVGSRRSRWTRRTPAWPRPNAP